MQESTTPKVELMLSRGCIPLCKVLAHRTLDYLESQGCRFLSPNPFRSSFVTKHVTINTSALIDIVIGVPLAELLFQVEVKTGVKLRKGISKANLYGDPNELVDTSSHKTFHHAHFKRYLWSVLSNLGKPKTPVTWNDLCFNNLVTTNGYKVNFALHRRGLLLEETLYEGRTQRQGRQQRRLPVRPQAIPATTHRDTGYEVTVTRCRSWKGKHCVLNDGVSKSKEGKRLRYTAAQRRHETSQKRNRQELDKMLDISDDNGVTIRDHVESLSGSQSSEKSSNITSF